MAQEITFTKQADSTWQGSLNSTGTRTIIQVERQENAPLYINISADNGQHNVIYQPPKDFKNQILSIDIAEGALVTIVSHSAVTKAQYIASSLDYYTKAEVDELLVGIHQFEPVVASSLPTASADTMYKFYFIPKQSASEQTNTKEEWMTVKEGSTYRWEKIGETDVDLSDYVTATDLAATLVNYVTNDSARLLPTVTSSDNGKILIVNNGVWSAESVPVADEIFY